MLIIYTLIYSVVVELVVETFYDGNSSASDVCGALGFDSLVLCPAFIDFEFVNWSAEGATGKVHFVRYVSFIFCCTFRNNYFTHPSLMWRFRF